MVTAFDPDYTAALYCDSWDPHDRAKIPYGHFLADIPRWRRGTDGWTRRSGADALVKRHSITVTGIAGAVS